MLEKFYCKNSKLLNLYSFYNSSVAEVKANGAKTKQRLEKDISRARESAAKTQADIAQQVLDARKNANAEIEKSRAEVAKAIEEAQQNATSIIEKAQLEAMKAKEKSNSKIKKYCVILPYSCFYRRGHT